MGIYLYGKFIFLLFLCKRVTTTNTTATKRTASKYHFQTITNFIIIRFISLVIEYKHWHSTFFSGVYYQSSNTLCDETVSGVYKLSDCQAAATSLNLRYQSSFSSSYWPKGCFAYPQPNPRYIYMNTHNTGCCTGGETNANAKQICKSGNTLQLTILKFIFE